MQAWIYPHALGLAPMGTIKTPITLTFNVGNVLATVLTGQYYWGRQRANNTSLYAFTSLAAGVGCYTWDKYLRERDQNAMRTDPADHVYHQSSNCHIANIWGYNRLSDISKRSGPMRIIWDWNCHGGRLTRFYTDAAKATTASKCPLCGQPDSQRHWILRCPDPASARLRVQCTQKMEATLHDYMEGQHPPRKRIHMTAVELISTSYLHLISSHRHGHRATVGSFTRSFVTALRLSIGDTDDLTTFQQQEHINALKYVVLTCGKILAEHTHALWRQRTITGIQSYRALKLLHPDTLPSHVPLIPHADKGSLRQEQTEAREKYDTDNQFTEEEQGVFQTARDVMHEERRVPVGPQSPEAINSLVANLQQRRIPFTSNRRSFRRRTPSLPVSTSTNPPTINLPLASPTNSPISRPTPHTSPSSTTPSESMAPPTGLPQWRQDTGVTPPQWTLTSAQQLQTETLFTEIAGHASTDRIRLPGLSPTWEIPGLDLLRLKGTKQIANIILDSFVAYWSLRSPVPTASVPSDLFFRLTLNKADTLASTAADIRFYGLPGNQLTRDHDLIIPLQLPGHWTVAIVQPYANKIIYYDGYRGTCPGGSHAEVLPDLLEWLTEAYSTANLSPSQAVSKWTITCPADSPRQRDSHNCGPNTLMYIYLWIMHKRLSTTADWDPSNRNAAIASQQVKAMRYFIAHHLITQGGQELSPKWVSSSPDTTTAPATVIAAIRQSYSKVSQRANRPQNQRHVEASSGPPEPLPNNPNPNRSSPMGAPVRTTGTSSSEVFDKG